MSVKDWAYNQVANDAISDQQGRGTAFTSLENYLRVILTGKGNRFCKINNLVLTRLKRRKVVIFQNA